jgi:hypothetical protein
VQNIRSAGNGSASEEAFAAPGAGQQVSETVPVARARTAASRVLRDIKQKQQRENSLGQIANGCLIVLRSFLEHSTGGILADINLMLKGGIFSDLTLYLESRSFDASFSAEETAEVRSLLLSLCKEGGMEPVPNCRWARLEMRVTRRKSDGFVNQVPFNETFSLRELTGRLCRAIREVNPSRLAQVRVLGCNFVGNEIGAYDKHFRPLTTNYLRLNMINWNHAGKQLGGARSIVANRAITRVAGEYLSNVRVNIPPARRLVLEVGGLAAPS